MPNLSNVRRMILIFCLTCAGGLASTAWGQESHATQTLTQLALADDTDPKALLDAAFALRQKTFLEAIDASRREPIEQLLNQHARFARLLLFAIRPEDEPDSMAELLLRVNQSHPDTFEALPSLVAAIALVHDEQLYREIVENTVTAPEPIAILNYFVHNQKRLAIDPNQLPPDLLIWVVDTTAAVEEMQWALKRYGKQPRIGKAYFDLTYDINHFYRGLPKKVTQAGYTLPNLKRYGGVCADQAYYATMVGKAMGIPTAIAKGEAAQVFHAWTGFLQTDAKRARAAWNFSEGRYRAYKNMRGSILDPQTRQTVADSTVSLSAGLYRLKDKQRWEAAALSDALQQLIDDQAVTAADKLDLFSRILKHNPHHADAWSAIVALAETGQMSLEQKMQAAKALMRVAGKRHPDFTILFLKPIIATVADVKQQEKLWARAYELFADRKEVAAEVLMARAAAWAKRGETKKAGLLYQDVIKRYANAGPFVIEALRHTEKQLIDLGKPDAVPKLYAQTLKRIKPPGHFAPQFRKLSNWYRVAVLYKQKLEAAGKTREAAKLQTQIDKVIED